MPARPRGLIVYECDAEGCEETIEGVPHAWWKADTIEYHHGRTPRRKHFYFCSLAHLVAWLIPEGEAIVRPPAPLKEVKAE